MTANRRTRKQIIDGRRGLSLTPYICTRDKDIDIQLVHPPSIPLLLAILHIRPFVLVSARLFTVQPSRLQELFSSERH